MIELWNHLQLGREYSQLYQVRLSCVFKCLALISQMFSTDVGVSSSPFCSVSNCRIASPFGLRNSGHLISGGSNFLRLILCCSAMIFRGLAHFLEQITVTGRDR